MTLQVKDGMGSSKYLKARGEGTPSDPYIPEHGGERARVANNSRVEITASSKTYIAANPKRIGLVVVNEGAATLYLKFGATASPTSYTVPIYPQDRWIMDAPIWDGIIDGIGSSATGTANITELE